MRYEKEEPWGDDEHERRHGKLCEIVAIGGGVTVDNKKMKPVDFTRWAKKEEIILTDEQIERELDRLFGG